MVIEKINMLKAFLDIKDEDGGVVAAEMVLCAAYHDDDLTFKSPEEALVIFSRDIDVVSMAERIDDVIDCGFQVASQLAVKLVEHDSNCTHQMSNTDNQNELKMTEEELQDSGSIPTVIEQLIEREFSAMEESAVSQPSVREGVIADIKSKVLYEFAPVVINDVYKEVLDDSYNALQSFPPFVGMFGDSEEEYILTIPTNVITFPDLPHLYTEAFERLQPVSDSSRMDMFIASVEVAFNSETDQTCVGYGYSPEDGKWFPVFISKEMSFVECFERSKKEELVQDKDQLVAHVYARVQAGLMRSEYKSYGVMTMAYEESQWETLVMESLEL